MCDYNTGQCHCLTNVATAEEINSIGNSDDRQCRFCIQNYHGHYTGQGCQVNEKKTFYYYK